MNYQEWKQALREIPIEDICDAAGVERCGRKILCPEHPDRHFGSCVLYKNRYHCFACKGSGDGIMLVKHHLGLTWHQAAQWIGEQFHVPKPDSDPNSVAAVAPITKNQMELLGLKPYGMRPFLVCGYSEFKPDEDDVFRSDPEGYQMGELGAYYGLDQLYREDPEGFTFLIGEKLIDAVSCYLAWYQSRVWELPYWKDLSLQSVLEYALDQLQPICLLYEAWDPDFPRFTFPEPEVRKPRFQMTF